jgi:hypothetical protein
MPSFDANPDTAFLHELIQKSDNIDIGNPGEVLDQNTQGTYPEIATRQSTSSIEISFKRLAKSENFDGQYIAIHIPHSTSTIRFTIKHSLGRIPKGYMLLQAIGLETTAGGRRAIGANLSPDTQESKSYWSHSEMTFRWQKSSSDVHNTRLLLMVY